MSGPDPRDLLLPRPLRSEDRPGVWPVPRTLAVHLPPDDAHRTVPTALFRLRRAFARRGVELRRAAGDAPLTLRIADPEDGHFAESYRLLVTAGGAEIHAADPRGLLHAAATLAQWIALAGEEREGAFHLPALLVEDRPAFPHRGAMLDVARDKVPRLETLFGIVELLAGWKLNQLQLYTEHTFAYRGHETVWRDASPLTPDDVRALDAYCLARGVELVPNQNSFGHFHRWLIHDRYRPLAECPEGVEHPWVHPTSAGGREPFSLCATDPRSAELLADLYAQLLPCFTSRRFNVGLDESFDLGRCRSRRACEERGRHTVYLEFLRTVHRLAGEHGRRIQFWGDVVLEDPSVVPDLPADATALAWGYEAGHPFAEDGRKLAASGLDLHICPGTSAWASLGGRTTNALANLSEAATAGRDLGAGGLLITDWGDFGHLQPHPVSLPGLAAGAAAAWNPDRPAGAGDLPALLDRHALADPAGVAGACLTALGDAYRLAGGGNRNGSALFHLLLRPDKGMHEGRNEGLTDASLRAALDHLDAAAADLPAARMERSDADLVEAELRWVADAQRFACRLGLARLAAGREQPLEAVDAAARRHLSRDLDDLLERRRALWLSRNRPGGLDHALGWLEPLRRRLAAG